MSFKRPDRSRERIFDHISRCRHCYAVIRQREYLAQLNNGKRSEVPRFWGEFRCCPRCAEERWRRGLVKAFRGAREVALSRRWGLVH